MIDSPQEENPQEKNSKVKNRQESESQEKQINYNFNQVNFFQSLEPLEQKIYNIFRNNFFTNLIFIVVLVVLKE